MLVENFPIQVMLTYDPFNIFKTQIYNLEEGIRNKPEKALWTSSLRIHFGDDRFLSDWDRWCDAKSFRVRNYATVLLPKSKLNILDITSSKEEDPWYEELKLNFPHFLELSQYGNYEYIHLDYVELRDAGYDGVHIENAYSEISRMSFYGWDCESTVWLNPNFYSAYRGGTIDEINEWIDR